MYLEGSIKDYITDLAAKKPAPGGGSAAALCGALGVSLLEMSCNYTIGNEKFKEQWAQIGQILREVTSARERLNRLLDEDVAAYSKVAEAYKMPKETEQQKKVRKEAIQEAMKGSSSVAQEIRGVCLEVSKFVPVLLEKGNPNLASDVRCAKILLDAANEAAGNFI